MWLEDIYLRSVQDPEVAVLRLYGHDDDADQLEAERALAAVTGGM